MTQGEIMYKYTCLILHSLSGTELTSAYLSEESKSTRSTNKFPFHSQGPTSANMKLAGLLLVSIGAASAKSICYRSPFPTINYAPSGAAGDPCYYGDFADVCKTVDGDWAAISIPDGQPSIAIIAYKDGTCTNAGNDGSTSRRDGGNSIYYFKNIRSFRTYPLG